MINEATEVAGKPTIVEKAAATAGKTAIAEKAAAAGYECSRSKAQSAVYESAVHLLLFCEFGPVLQVRLVRHTKTKTLAMWPHCKDIDFISLWVFLEGF